MSAIALISIGLGAIGLLIALAAQLRLSRMRQELRQTSETLAETEARARKAARKAEVDIETVENANAAKSAFLANISHKIRMPMMGVLGLTDVLRNNADLNHHQSEIADTIHASGTALMTVLGDILDYSKIESGALELSITTANLRETAEEVSGLMAEQAREKGLDIFVHYAPDMPEIIEADIGRIRQVLLSLVGNALKFTSSGHVIINVNMLEGTSLSHSLSAEAACNHRVKIEVLDTGVGISKADQERIFDDFQHLDTGENKGYCGTGLGLSMAKKLVGALDGELTVRSHKGSGSVFCFELPIGVSEDNIAPPAPLFTSGHVLIIDTNSVRLKILSSQLKSLGLSPTVARSAAEGIEGLLHRFASGAPFDAVIIDQGCAGDDDEGGSFAARLKSSPSLADINVILLSNLTERGGLDAQDYAHLVSKPVAGKALSLALTKVLSVSHHQAAGPVKTSKTKSKDARQRVRPVGVANAPKRTSRRILLAEGNPVTRHVIQAFLDDKSIQLHCVEDGEAALSSAKAVDFDLILMDAQLRKLDGFLTTRAIRGHEKEIGATPTPIICFSPHKLGADEDLALAIGMNDFLVKPLTHDALDIIMNKWGHVKAQSAAVNEGKRSSAKLDPMTQTLQPKRKRVG